jgi:type II restriction enzyme
MPESIRLADGNGLHFTEGKRSRLIRAIVEKFTPRFAPGGELLYVRDTGGRWAYFDEAALRVLGVAVEDHGTMPDVVIYDKAKERLFLIEAAISRSPIGADRLNELARLFAGAKPGLVFVSAFLNRRDVAKHIGEIAWETTIWPADEEAHLMHFDGERLAGPDA